MSGWQYFPVLNNKNRPVQIPHDVPCYYKQTFQWKIDTAQLWGICLKTADVAHCKTMTVAHQTPASHIGCTDDVISYVAAFILHTYYLYLILENCALFTSVLPCLDFMVLSLDVFWSCKNVWYSVWMIHLRRTKEHISLNVIKTVGMRILV